MNSKNRFVGFIKSIGYNVKRYQVNGFEWCYNKEKTGGGLLCYEMGLGKTILMLSCIKLNPKMRTLIVLPKALINQWTDKIRGILQIEPYVYSSSAKLHAMDYNTKTRILNNQSIIVTTYGMIACRKYKNQEIRSPLWNIKWDRVIYDEAHNMRNGASKLYSGATKINSNIYWMMTGTPIQNRWSDVVSLCLLSRIPELINAIKSKDIDNQMAVIKKYMMYNTKKNVNIKMPKLNLHVHKVPFKNEEKLISEDIHSCMNLLNHNLNRKQSDLIKYMDCWFSYACRAKQVCAYSKLLENCVKKKLTQNNDEEMSSLNSDTDEEENIPNFDTLDNSKIDYLIDLIKKSDKCKKKIVFCSFIKEGEKIQQILSNDDYVVGIVNGSTPKNMRRILLTSNNIDVLIIQIQCGSDGLNLQQYEQIYFTSPHWNPAVEQQAIGRIYRIGQKADSVDVHSLVSHFDIDNGETMDEYCLSVQKRKEIIIKQLFDNVIKKKKKKLKIVEKYSKAI